MVSGGVLSPRGLESLTSGTSQKKKPTPDQEKACADSGIAERSVQVVYIGSGGAVARGEPIEWRRPY